MMSHILLRKDLRLFRIYTETLPRTLDTEVYSILGFSFRADKAISLDVKQLRHSENQVRAAHFRGCCSMSSPSEVTGIIYVLKTADRFWYIFKMTNYLFPNKRIAAYGPSRYLQ